MCFPSDPYSEPFGASVTLSFHLVFIYSLSLLFQEDVVYVFLEIPVTSNFDFRSLFRWAIRAKYGVPGRTRTYKKTA